MNAADNSLIGPGNSTGAEEAFCSGGQTANQCVQNACVQQQPISCKPNYISYAFRKALTKRTLTQQRRELGQSTDTVTMLAYTVESV